MKRHIRLNETQLTNIIKRVIKEQSDLSNPMIPELTNEQRVHMLEEAKEKLKSAYLLIRRCIDNTELKRTDKILDDLKPIINGHGYYAYDGVEQYIEIFENGGRDVEDYEDDNPHLEPERRTFRAMMGGTDGG